MYEQNLSTNNIIEVAADGVPAMIRGDHGFVKHLRDVNQDTKRNSIASHINQRCAQNWKIILILWQAL